MDLFFCLFGFRPFEPRNIINYLTTEAQSMSSALAEPDRDSS